MELKMLDDEISQSHYNVLRQMVGLDNSEPFPSEMANRYLRVRRAFDCVDQPVGMSELALVAFADPGFGVSIAGDLVVEGGDESGDEATELDPEVEPEAEVESDGEPETETEFD